MKKTVIIVVVLILVGLAIVYRNQIRDFFTGSKTLTGGAPPTADDEVCGSMTIQRTGTGRIVQACTKPLYRKVGTARERAWVMETDDYPFDTCQGGGTTIKTQDGTKWWYNYQSGAKCIYISDNRFPFIS